MRTVQVRAGPRSFGAVFPKLLADYELEAVGEETGEADDLGWYEQCCASGVLHAVAFAH